jgi:glycosyltransferase involved in cell wall biosynthesis
MRANTVYILSHDPLVVTGGFSTLEAVAECRRPMTFLYHNVGWLRAHSLPRYIKASRKFIGDRRLMIVTNEPSEARWLRLAGIESYALSHNIHVRDHFFTPQPQTPKLYDAVYSAQLAPFKRLELARDIRSLRVVTYAMHKQEWDLHAYVPSLGHATFNKTWLTPDEVREAYRSARVGLALSKKEGAMFASMEYLMCGLPVVTTRNRGGRNRYFTPRNSTFVAARPAAAARAVSAYVALPPDPMQIREEVMRLVRRDRLAYLDVLSRRCAMTIRDREDELDRLWGGQDGIEKHAVPIQSFVASHA